MQNKPCDWLCAQCKNLNYSFRKNCNRCHYSRESKGTKFLKREQLNVFEDLKLQSSNHSTQSSETSDNETEVFPQALFLEHSSKELVSKNFSFHKQCTNCRVSNYFYSLHCVSCSISLC